MKFINKAIFITFSAILILLLVAMPVLAATYYGILLAQETTGTSHTKLPIIFDVNNDWMVAQGFMDSTGLDTRVQSGGSNIPHMVADNKTLVAVDMPANSNKSLIYSMGETLAASMSTIVGQGGEFSVVDEGSIELGDNFTVEVDGWWNTDNGTDKNAVYKADAFEITTSNNTDISAAILDPSAIIEYDVNDDAAASVFITSWNAQTFTTINATYVRSVEIKVYEAGTPPGVSVNITATAAGVPTATVLASKYVGTATTASWGAAPGAWQTVTFDGIGASLSAATMYAITISTLDGDAGNNILWRHDASAPTYAGGTRASSNDRGDTWASDATRDFMFRINSYIGPVVTATGVASGEHTVTVDNLHNMLINGNFESGNPPTSWSGSTATLAQDGVTKYLDSYSVKITSGGQYAYAYQNVPNFADYAGETVALGARYYIPTTTTTTQSRFQINDGVGFTYGSILAKDDAWHWAFVSHSVDAIPTQLNARFYVTQSDNDADDVIYIDAAVLVHRSTVPTGGNFAISIDDVVKDATFTDNTTEVPDNANNWTFMQNDVLHWADNITFEIDGVQQLYFAPVDIIAGTVLPDRAGADNPGAITWGANPAGISVNFTSFQPVTEAKAPAFSLGDEPLFITATPNITSEFTVVPPAGTFPLAGVIAAVANASSTPAQLPLLIIAAFVILAASLCISYIMRQHGSGTVFVKILAIAAFMGIFIALANFGIDFWMLVVFLIISTAMAMASKQLGWT